MKVVFDTSVWIEHLRHGTLTDRMPRLRGRAVVWGHTIVGAELVAGCRNRRERKSIETLLQPFGRSERVIEPTAGDYDRAAVALSRLRERGRSLRHPGGALLDAVVAASCVRYGARLVTLNPSDFSLLAQELPLSFDSLDGLDARLRQ